VIFPPPGRAPSLSELRRALRPLFWRGKRAWLAEANDAPRAKQFAELFRRMTVPGTGSLPYSGNGFFEMSASLMAWKGHDWAWPPVLRYTSVHLRRL
jgi:hypothetical protein